MTYCQFNEEEIITKILEQYPPTNKMCVEIGCLPDFKFSNIQSLIEQGWKGWMFDKGERQGVIQAKFTPENINQILRENNVPQDLDLLSIDIDGNDYYLFEALEFQPKILIIEYNAHLAPNVKYDYNEDFEWKSGNAYGASFECMNELAARKGYKLFDKNSDNLFYVRDNRDTV